MASRLYNDTLFIYWSITSKQEKVTYYLKHPRQESNFDAYFSIVRNCPQETVSQGMKTRTLPHLVPFKSTIINAKRKRRVLGTAWSTLKNEDFKNDAVQSVGKCVVEF